MITYRDMTFCVNEECQKRCSKFLTDEIREQAARFGLPIAVCSFICLNQGEDGVYEKMP